MWVFEEKVDGKNLTEIINETHCNVKYLPDFTLPDNVVRYNNLCNEDTPLFRTLSNGVLIGKVPLYRKADYICMKYLWMM